MCGLIGFLGGTRFSDGAGSHDLLARMACRIRHRGPDHSAVWQDKEAGIGFGHNRLAIVDLSPAGQQPMHSASGRYVIAYNGELYNHLDLRRELEAARAGSSWRGHSDTETLLAAVEAWGVTAALQRAIGMFAFALWDRREQSLILGRDRLGEKPLYYGWQGRGTERSFLFGSELTPLRLHPSFEDEIDTQALALFMRHNCVPAPHTIYRGMFKLLPGCTATIRKGTETVEVAPYWSAAEAIGRGHADAIQGSDSDIVDQLEALLKDAVGRQMMSDVPLGAFLSGGIDSSTVVALMQAQSSRPVRTFSIGFYEEGYNEAEHAKAVAGHLGTDHTELYVTSDEARNVIPKLPEIYDEPFADSSQIPTYLVSQLARQHVTVSLSGDAGDELFAGYNRYLLTDRLWKRLGRTPRPLRRTAAAALASVSPSAWDRVARAGSRIVPPLGRWSNVGHKIHKGVAVLASATPEELYRGMVSHWKNPSEIVVGGSEPSYDPWAGVRRLNGLSDVERMMSLDLVTYLPDDILTKVDRAAMAVSLETRVPFLDHRVVEFAWRLPQSLKLRDGQTKWVLRQVLDRYVPRAMIDRPKMGFGLPLGEWLRGPLRDWAESLLDESRLRQEGFLHPKPVREAWATHLAGRTNLEHHLWDVLMFQAWLERQGSAGSVAPMEPCHALAANG